jgi:hypothetical protein
MLQPGNIFHPSTQVYEKETLYLPNRLSRGQEERVQCVKNGENMKKREKICI